MRARLLLVFVGVLAVVLLAHDIPLSAHLERVERDRLATKLERDAFILAGRLARTLEAGTTAGDSEVSALVARYSATEDVRVVVVDRSALGVVGSEEAGSLGEDFSNRPEFQTAMSGEPTTGQRESATLGEDLFYVAVPVLSGDDVVGVVRISAPERVVSERASERVRNLFVVAGISLVIAVAVALLFAVYVTRPLHRLRGATVGLAGGDLARRADIESGPPEVRDLATSFNTMADRLEQNVERQRSFAGTASHQLRTPLTALRLQLDRLATEVDDGPARDTTDQAIAETDRLHRIVEGLLALSRAEARTTVEPVDIGRVTRERVEEWSALADERSVRLVHTRPDPDDAPLTAAVVDGAAEQIIDNLIDNALEVSPPDSTIRVSLAAAPDHIELHLRDEGSGLTDEQRSLAFERFWRAPDAAPGGSGLGLPIVRELARASGGDAELRPVPAGGLEAVVTLRRADRMPRAGAVQTTARR